MKFTKLLLIAISFLVASNLGATNLLAQQADFYVATTGNDANEGTFQQPFRNIQHAIDVATTPGNRVIVRGGTYNERLQFVASGNSRNGYITLRNYPNETVVLDGTGVPGSDMVLIENLHHIRLIGFEIVNNLNVVDGSGVRILGWGYNLTIRDNVIHEMRGENAMGITVYGTSTEQAVSKLFIYNNHVYNCDPAPSEAIVVNGNVAKFTIAKNLVHDVNNIGIDAIGGELDINPDPNLVARNGWIRDNVVYRARSNYGGGFGAGIYVDGGKNIRIDSNRVFECDLGIEIGAENPWATTRNVIVQNNIVTHNDKAGIVFGGYDSDRGRVVACRFINNTLFRNDLLEEGFGQIWVQFADNNIIANNIVWGSDSTVLLQSEFGVGNQFDHNLWYYEGGTNGSEFYWQGNGYTSFAAYKNATGQGANSIFSNPLFVSHADDNFDLTNGSPAIDNGTDRRGWFGQRDFRDTLRPQGTNVDIGAVEPQMSASKIYAHIDDSESRYELDDELNFLPN